MANNALNVSVGKPMAAGGIYSADMETAIPTDATSELTGFTSLGYVSEDGLSNDTEQDSENIVAWGGDTVLQVTTSRTETFGFTFIETNSDVLKEVYGPDNVTVSGDTITVAHNNKQIPRRRYVFEILLTDNKVKRIVVPQAQVALDGAVEYTDGDPIGYPVLLTTFPDETGTTVYEHIAKISSGD